MLIFQGVYKYLMNYILQLNTTNWTVLPSHPTSAVSHSPDQPQRLFRCPVSGIQTHQFHSTQKKKQEICHWETPQGKVNQKDSYQNGDLMIMKNLGGKYLTKNHQNTAPRLQWHILLGLWNETNLKGPNGVPMALFLRFNLPAVWFFTASKCWSASKPLMGAGLFFTGAKRKGISTIHLCKRRKKWRPKILGAENSTQSANCSYPIMY